MAKKPTYEELEQRVKELENGAFDRKQVEKQSQLEHARLMGILESIPDGVYIVDQHFNIEYINPVIEREFGKIHGRKCYEDFHNRTELCPWCKNEEVFSGRSISWEWYSIKNDRYYELFDTPFKNLEGSISKLEIFHDITDRKRSEEALKRSAERFRRLFEQASDAFFIHDFNNGKILEANECACRNLGYTRGELLELNVSDIEISHTPETIVEICTRAEKGSPVIVEGVHRRKDGSTFPVEISLGMLQDEDPTLLLAIVRDTAERKQTQEALRESEGRFSTMFEHMSSGVAVYESVDNGEDFVFRAFNPEAERITRISQREALGNRLLGLFPHMDKSGFLGALQRVWKTGQEEHLPPFFYKDEKREGWRENRIYKLPTGEVVALFDDVTESKQAEEALRESEDKFRNFTEQSLVGIYLISDDVFKYVNPKFAEIFGYSVDECLNNMHFPQLVHPEDLATVKKQVSKRLSEETKSVRYSFRGIKKSGETIHVEIFGSSMVLKGKTVATGTMLEITERKQAEEALRESEAKFRRISENTPAVVYQFKMTPDGAFTFPYVNDAVKAIMGVAAEDVKRDSSNLLGVIHPEDQKMFLEGVMKSAETLETYHEIFRCLKDGKVIWVECRTQPTPMRDGSILWDGFFVDITERKHAEEALRESEEQYRTFVDNLPVAVYRNTPGPEGAFIMANPAFCKMFGFKNEEEVKKVTPASLYQNPEERKQYSDNLIQKGVFKNDERALQKRDGTPVYTSITSRVVYRKDGEISYFDSMMLDITEKKLAEERLRESEEKYRSMMESMKDPIYICSLDYRVEYMNPSMIQRTGHDATGEKCFKALHDLDEKCPWCMHDEAQQPEYCETDIVSPKDNRSYHVSSSPVVHEDGTISKMTVLRDTTDLKKLETQLQQAQKMEAIGTLAGGVAHDLNNILGGLVSYPELLLLQLPEDSPLRKSILTIQKSGEKAAAVVQDLLTLARRGVVVTEVVNLNDVIAEYLKSSELESLQSYHPGVHIETNLEKDVLNILGSSTHLSKTVMNLTSNAAEAMLEGGKLTVTTENQYIDRPISGYDELKEGDYVVLTVSDTGTGIDPDDMEKIFEPFYTKKKMGRSGTGLGMAVVWGTVKDHNGYIHVQSTEGAGTTFTLYFPVTRKLLEERSEISLKDYIGKGEAILIVDDVEEQRKIASGMLKELGYSVVSVSSGEEAVEYLRSNKVDLLVLDMIMDPGMDGLDTYRKILEMHSEQKAIIASGFSETDRVKEVQSLGAGAYIRKPLLLKKVGLAVKEELERQAVREELENRPKGNVCG